MSRSTRSSNPLFGLVVVAGILFAVTACAYFVMALRGTRSGYPVVAVDGHRADRSAMADKLLQFLARHGLATMIGELGVLALATFGAIATDGYWTRRADPDAGGEVDESQSLRRS